MGVCGLPETAMDLILGMSRNQGGRSILQVIVSCPLIVPDEPIDSNELEARIQDWGRQLMALAFQQCWHSIKPKPRPVRAANSRPSWPTAPGPTPCARCSGPSGWPGNGVALEPVVGSSSHWMPSWPLAPTGPPPA